MVSAHSASWNNQKQNKTTQSAPPSSSNSKPFPHLMLLAATGLFMIAGSSAHNSNGAAAQWIRTNAESILVTIYTIAITFYLLWVATRHYIQAALQKLFPTEYKQQPPALLSPQKRTADSVRPLRTSRGAATVVAPPANAVTTLDKQKSFDKSDGSDQQPVNMTGAYRLISNEGFEDFLAVQGVPWALRRVASQARPLHRITHIGHKLTIKIEGVIESQTTYMIGGPPVETNVRGRIFEDSVTYLTDKKGILVSKRAITEEYDVTVQRVLADDGKKITMTSTAHFRDGKPPVKSTQIFHRVNE